MDDYTHSMGVFLNKNNIRIFHRCWSAEKPRAVVLIAHGLGEHCGRYKHLIRRLRGHHISFYAIDHKGHGKSGGKRGHTERFTDYVDDLKQFKDTVIDKEMHGVPVFLLGHSMGGLIATQYALTHPDAFDGLILSAPAFMLARPMPAVQAGIVKILSAMIPRVTMPNRLNPADLSSDTAVVAAYINDPLVHERVSMKWLVEFTATAEACLSQTARLTLPLLIIHGKGDRIVAVKGSEIAYQNAQSTDKQLALFDRLRHETMNEQPAERKEPLDMVAQWIMERTEQSEKTRVA
ncbi:MAG: alpha/beta hydrolase [Thermodesulfobacteriota bacterium]|nr:alpha/beta hydrolase [Thermodesulfobacteriota bacterium]